MGTYILLTENKTNFNKIRYYRFISFGFTNISSYLSNFMLQIVFILIVHLISFNSGPGANIIPIYLFVKKTQGQIRLYRLIHII